MEPKERVEFDARLASRLVAVPAAGDDGAPAQPQPAARQAIGKSHGVPELVATLRRLG